MKVQWAICTHIYIWGRGSHTRREYLVPDRRLWSFAIDDVSANVKWQDRTDIHVCRQTEGRTYVG